jgi:hypothetical protein
MNRLTKAIVLASTLAAAYIELSLATTPLFPFLFWFSIALAAVWFVAGRRVHFAGLPVAMFAIYVGPAVYLQVGIRPDYGLEMIWIFPLVGLLMSGRSAWEWSLPQPWRWPLVAWAVVVSVTWPIILLREVDFYWTVIHFDGVYNSSDGIFPVAAAANIAYFALGHTVGILWIDALYRWSGEAAVPRLAWLKRHVLYPLAGAAAVAALVAAYQGFVDLQFMNTRFWAYMLRASGTLGDPNKLGMIAAFWAMGSVALGRALPKPWSSVVSIGGVFVGLGGIWMSSSRTGLAAVLIGLAALAVEGARHLRAHREVSPRRLLFPAAIIVVIGAALAISLTQSRTHTFYGRGVHRYIPFYGDIGIARSVNDLLWERYGYGPAAIQMLREQPLAGVGVGAVHTLVYDYGKLAGYDLEDAADNAQSWYRHLLAELGILGSIPWIVWCVMFASFLFRRGAGEPLTIGILRGALLGFGVASLFGMAGQAMAIIVTFWTFAAWVAFERGLEPNTRFAWSRRTVTLTTALVLLHAAVTFAHARGDLLPRNRAQRFGWPYNYGFFNLERDPGGGPDRRWTFERALATIPVQGRVLKFVGWIDHPDADEHPVQVLVWADSKLVFSGDLRRSASITLDIPATPGEKHLILETWISRTWRPSDYGRGDRRQLGLSVRDWAWE